MRVDLHCHTLATKKGDPTTRNVDKETFANTLVGKVDLVAITNHNYFDLCQFKEFATIDSLIVWPGIEVDILENMRRYHCIVISNPKKVNHFDEIVSDMTKENANDFKCSIDEFIHRFKELDCIVMAHYYSKENAFENDMVEKLQNAFSKINVFVEPSNLRSATILQAHNYHCLVGSDVDDWNEYKYDELPTLKKKFDSFDKFKLLLQKDDKVIKTTLDEELFETIKIKPFSGQKNSHELNFNIYRDVNIFFGGKGTGKTDILTSLREYFNVLAGNQYVSYYKAKEVAGEYNNLIKNTLSNEEFDSLEYPNITQNLENLRNWNEPIITTTADYYVWKKIQDTNKNNKRLGIRNATSVEVLSLQRFIELKAKLEEFQKSSLKIIKVINEENLLNNKDIINLEQLFQEAKTRIYKLTEQEWIEYKSLELEKFTIKKIKRLSESKTGEPSKPSDLGLYRTFVSLSNMAKDLNEIMSLSKLSEKKIRYPLGQLENKGKAYINRQVTTLTDVTHYIFEIGKERLIQANRSTKELIKSVFKEDLNARISDFKEKLTGFVDTRSFVGYRTTVCLEDGVEYQPSDGEQSMLLLSQSIIHDDKQVYILDEPELSVGHQYINNVIIPRIKELARQKKVIIIATHDANIAVRTLPYLSVFRKYENGVYYNYIGSSLEQNMHDTINNSCVNWTDACITTLEGGREAFDERGRIYG